LGFSAKDNIKSWLSPAANSGYDSKAKEGEPDVCFEGTRVELLEMIDAWFDNPDSKSFFWLSGLAGTGKSMISRTVAKRLKANGALGGSFFFSRWEFNITDPFCVFRTLAYHLSLYDNSFLENLYRLRNKYHDAPTLRSLEDQFKKLILEPMLSSQFHRPTVGIIIDAVDEGDEGVTNVISLLVGEIRQLHPSVRLKVFVTSREQPDASLLSLSSDFQDFQLHNIEDSIIKHDINLYLSSQLKDLRPVEVPPPWPAPEDLAALVAKANKLFIYAATAVKFIKNPQWRNPQQQLKRLLSAPQGVTESSPWRELDETYRRVLKDALEIGGRVDEELVTRFKAVVGAIILLQSPLSVTSLEALLQMPKEVIPTVGMLHSVFVIPKERDADRDGIRSFHPSFPEFLLQRSSEDVFFIVQESHHARLAMLCLKCISGIEDHPMDRFGDCPIPSHVQYSCLHLGDHVSKASLDTNLLKALDEFSSRYLLRWVKSLHYIERDDRVTSSLKQIREWAVSMFLNKYNGEC
jgi:hypothetical protein